jgi:hypothetical protein
VRRFVEVGRTGGHTHGVECVWEGWGGAPLARRKGRHLRLLCPDRQPPVDLEALRRRHHHHHQHYHHRRRRRRRMRPQPPPQQQHKQHKQQHQEQQHARARARAAADAADADTAAPRCGGRTAGGVCEVGPGSVRVDSGVLKDRLAQLARRPAGVRVLAGSIPKGGREEEVVLVVCVCGGGGGHSLKRQGHTNNSAFGTFQPPLRFTIRPPPTHPPSFASSFASPRPVSHRTLGAWRA